MDGARPHFRPAWSEIDLDAIRGNVATLVELARPAELLAVVKADGYGHGAVEVARAALDAGASWLGVALVEEGVVLRDAGIQARVMVLSELPLPSAAAVVEHDLTPVVYTLSGIEGLAKAVVESRASGRDRVAPLPVHLKVDTGMHRVGCAPSDAVALVAAIAARDELAFEGCCTHLAAADDLDNPYTAEQLTKFEGVLAEIASQAPRPAIVHAANSAGLLAHPSSHYDLVRVGIALYGIPPAPKLADRVALQPAMSLHARVSHVKTLPTGAPVSYGLRYEVPRAGRLATVPVGYADGVPRNLGLAGGEVLIRGRRFPIAGSVTMDQLMVDVGDAPVDEGDEVVLLGGQGDAAISAGEWAERLDTIAYEIVTGIGPRVPRRYVGSSGSVPRS